MISEELAERILNELEGAVKSLAVLKVVTESVDAAGQVGLRAETDMNVIGTVTSEALGDAEGPVAETLRAFHAEAVKQAQAERRTLYGLADRFGIKLPEGVSLEKLEGLFGGGGKGDAPDADADATDASADAE